MKRFLMLLAVAAVAGVMYVAAAPGSAQHAGPTWRQYSALLKQFAAVKKEIKQLKTTSARDDGFIKTCFANAAPVGVFGDTTDFQAGATQTYGYEYDATAPAPGAESSTPTFNTALNIDTNTTPQAFFQVVDSSCVQPGAGAASHAGSHLLLRPEGKR
jgi:hypothetical protein